MVNEIINNEQLVNALTDKWKTAAQLRDELQITAGTKKIGQTLRKIRLDHREIETKMRGRVLLYRIPGVEVAKPLTPVVTEPEQVIEPPKTEPQNIAKELDSLIHELKSQGVNVQEICYLALRDRKEKLESELRYLREHAPIFADEYRKLQDELQRMKNQLQDYKDIVDRKESESLVKRFSEERKVRQGVVTG